METKQYKFTANGKSIFVESETMKKAIAKLKAELLLNLPKEYTSRHPLTLKAYDTRDGVDVAFCGWNLFYPNGKDVARVRRTAEFRRNSFLDWDFE